MLPFIYFFIPLYKALDTNQSSLYKHCFLENTKGVAVKSRKYCTKQHGMTDTERCGTLRVSLCKCLYWNTLEKVIYFSFNQKCSSVCVVFLFFFTPPQFQKCTFFWPLEGKKIVPDYFEKYASKKVALSSSFQEVWHIKRAAQ